MLGHGWVIGTLNWHEKPGASLSHDASGTYATALMEDMIQNQSNHAAVDAVMMHDGLIPVVPYADGYAFVSPGYAWSYADMMAAYQAIQKLVDINT